MPTSIYPGATGSNGTRPLSAAHGFLEGHRRLRRPSNVIGADARLLGHLNYLQSVPFLGSRNVLSALLSSGTTPAQPRPLLIWLHVSSAR